MVKVWTAVDECDVMGMFLSALLTLVASLWLFVTFDQEQSGIKAPHVVPCKMKTRKSDIWKCVFSDDKVKSHEG